MQAALEISFYVIAVVFAIGMLMVLVLLKDVFFHGRFTAILPAVKRVPTTSLEAVRAVLKELKSTYATARGPQRDTIAYEIKHLEHRISTLEDKTYIDQSDYYDAAKARERGWREWRALHEEARQGGYRKRRELRTLLDEKKAAYRQLEREVDEEFHRAVARDSLTLEELRSQGVLDPGVLRPEEPTAAADSGVPEPGDAQPPPEEETPTGGGQRASKWSTPLPPYPPAAGGQLRQTDMALPDLPKTERTYTDPTFNLSELQNGLMSGVDFSLSSFAEVAFVGVHRYQDCTFIGTDLRRIELDRVEGALHVFQGCDFRGASFAQSTLSGVVFRRCNLANTHWRGARLDRVKLEQCSLDDIHWEGVDLGRCIVSEDMLAGADYSQAGRPPHNDPAAEGAPAPAPQPGPPRQEPGPDSRRPVADTAQEGLPQPASPPANDVPAPTMQPEARPAAETPDAQAGRNPRAGDE